MRKILDNENDGGGGKIDITAPLYIYMCRPFYNGHGRAWRRSCRDAVRRRAWSPVVPSVCAAVRCSCVGLLFFFFFPALFAVGRGCRAKGAAAYPAADGARKKKKKIRAPRPARLLVCAPVRPAVRPVPRCSHHGAPAAMPCQRPYGRAHIYI